MFIQFLDFSFGTWESAFLVKEENDYCYYVSPACAAWAKKLNVFHRMNEVRAPKIPSSFFQYKPHPQLTPYIPGDLFNFPLADSDIADMDYIVHAFMDYEKYCRLPLNKRLEKTISVAKIFLGENILKRLVSFWLRDADMDGQRIRLLLNPVFESLWED